MSKFTDLAVRYIADLRSDFQLEPFQAAGIVGNGGEESGGFEKVHETDPIGGGAGGLGHFQWTGRSSANNRRLLFEQWLGRPEHVAAGWTPDTYAANYSMLYRELRPGGTEHASLVAVQQTSTLEEATEVFMHKFERPNEDYLHLDVRINWAKKALAAYVAAGSPVAAPPSPVERPPVPPINDVVIPQPGGAAQPRDFEATLLRILTVLTALMNRMGDVSTMVAAKPTAPPSKVEPKAVALGIGTFFAGLGAQLHGTVPPPEGLDSIINLATSPAMAGTLTTLIPLATTALGLTGGWGALAAGVMSFVGPSIERAAEARAEARKQKQGTP